MLYRWTALPDTRTSLAGTTSVPGLSMRRGKNCWSMMLPSPRYFLTFVSSKKVKQMVKTHSAEMLETCMQYYKKLFLSRAWCLLNEIVKNVMCKTKIINGYIYSLYNLFYFWNRNFATWHKKHTHKGTSSIRHRKSPFFIFPSYDLMGGCFCCLSPLLHPFSKMTKYEHLFCCVS